METRRPPQLGTLVQVVPAVQLQHREPWTLTLVSVERWDNCFVASFDLLRAGPVDHSAGLHPWLEVNAVDDRGGRYQTWFGGGYGGGLRDGGDIHRDISKFTPPLAPSASELRLTARLQLLRQEGGFPPRQVVVWEDPEPWVFPVALSGSARPAGRDERAGELPRPTATPLRSGPPDLRRLLDVVPVVQTQEAGGWAITCVAAELYDEGFRLVFRLYGAERAPTNPGLVLRVRDDRGNDYVPWPGGGNGEPVIGGCHWRTSCNCAPALDPESRELWVEIAEVQATAIEPEDGRPGRGRSVVSAADAGDWRFTVRLR